MRAGAQTAQLVLHSTFAVTFIKYYMNVYFVVEKYQLLVSKMKTILRSLHAFLKFFDKLLHLVVFPASTLWSSVNNRNRWEHARAVSPEAPDKHSSQHLHDMCASVTQRKAGRAAKWMVLKDVWLYFCRREKKEKKRVFEEERIHSVY